MHVNTFITHILIKTYYYRFFFFATDKKFIIKDFFFRWDLNLKPYVYYHVLSVSTLKLTMTLLNVHIVNIYTAPSKKKKQFILVKIRNGPTVYSQVPTVYTLRTQNTTHINFISSLSQQETNPVKASLFSTLSITFKPTISLAVLTHSTSR